MSYRSLLSFELLSRNQQNQVTILFLHNLYTILQTSDNQHIHACQNEYHMSKFALGAEQDSIRDQKSRGIGQIYHFF